MNKKELYDKIIKFVPVPKCEVNEFDTTLNVHLRKYWNLLQQYDFRDVSSIEKDMILNDVNHLIDHIVGVTELVLSGNYIDAYSFVSSKFGFIMKKVHTIKKETSFYRMRVVEDKDKRDMSFKDMFHIPFNKRSIVSTQRYSTPGYPCLYLGGTSYGCWEELGRPNLDSCMISRLENTEDFDVWDLRIPKLEDWNNKDILINNLTLFPLVIACMYMVNNEKGNFKHEYIIPQILLNFIHSNTNIKGIAYTSVHKNRNFRFPDYVFDNFVIPVRQKSEDYCPELCHLFRITKPTCEEYERIRDGLVNDMKPEGYANLKEDDIRYKKSLFGIIDSKLLIHKIFIRNTIKPKMFQGSQGTGVNP